MNGKTSKLVNFDRVIELLECYGTNADCWPEDERAAAIALIKNSTELQQRQLDAEQLDDVMDVYNVRQSIHTRAKIETVNRIVGQLPEQDRQNIKPINHRPATYATQQTKAWQKYGMAAALAAIFITALVVIEQPSPTQPQLVSNTSEYVVDQWMWQEIYGTMPPQGESEEPLTFMALVDLESLPSDE
jgi:hypothetical protein